MLDRSSSAGCSSRSNACSAPDKASAEVLTSPYTAACDRVWSRLEPTLDRLLSRHAARRGPIAVAVSGGPDSTALLILMARWIRERGGAADCRAGDGLHVLHVDHGLRVAAQAEAAHVRALSHRLGVPCTILRWTGAKPLTGLQSAAREARWSLLRDACRSLGAVALVLAHHRDDQAETVLHRVDRGTGPDGLAAMAERSDREGLAVIRPLLNIPKQDLVDLCEEAEVSVSDDPSNRDRRFARTELRDLAGHLAESGLTPDRLVRLSAAMAGARDAMDRVFSEWAAQHVTLSSGGSIDIPLIAFRAMPYMAAQRALVGLLQVAGGCIYPPSEKAVTQMWRWLGEDGGGNGGGMASGRARTLGGCRIEVGPGNTVTICREWQAIRHQLDLLPGRSGLWDGRFAIENKGKLPVRISRLGERGMALWRRSGGCEQESGLQGRIRGGARLALPMVRGLDGPVAAPHLQSMIGGDRSTGESGFSVRFLPKVVPAWLISAPVFNGRDALHSL